MVNVWGADFEKGGPYALIQALSGIVTADFARRQSKKLVHEVRVQFSKLDNSDGKRLNDPKARDFLAFVKEFNQQLDDPQVDPWAMYYTANAVHLTAQALLGRIGKAAERGAVVKRAGAKGPPARKAAMVHEVDGKAHAFATRITEMRRRNPRMSFRSLARRLASEFGQSEESLRKKIAALIKTG